ncbi:MAG: hypothetical protein HY960_02740 [Ignavibacteriae bacterium]|nr:hypothetical protein [Ignavibacteriota bacterium]
MFFILLLAVPSCLSVQRTVDQIESFELSGMMHYTSVEGGCWQFIGNDGETYELTGSRVVILLREGLRADLVVRGPLDLASVCQVGEVVEILEIIRTYTD